MKLLTESLFLFREHPQCQALGWIFGYKTFIVKPPKTCISKSVIIIIII